MVMVPDFRCHAYGLKSPPPNSRRRRQAEAAQVIDALNLKMAVRNSQSPPADDAIAQYDCNQARTVTFATHSNLI